MGGEVGVFVDDGQFAEGVEVSEVGGGEAAVFFDPFLPGWGCRIGEAAQQGFGAGGLAIKPGAQAEREQSEAAEAGAGKLVDFGFRDPAIAS